MEEQKEKKLEKKKLINRYFCGILYEDNDQDKIYLKRIQDNFTEVTWITHDRDIIEDTENEEETKKKKHIHVLFKVGENARHRHAIAKIIGIGENYLEGCNKDKMLYYFLHKNNPEKTQYDINEVQGELKEYLAKKLSGSEPQENKLDYIADMINNKYITNEYQLIKQCIAIQGLDILQRFGYIFTRMLKNNKRIDKEEEL